MDKVNDLIYTVRKKMLADDVTMFRKLRPSVLLRLIQEISIAHTEALGAGRAKTLDKGVLWVVARMKITFFGGSSRVFKSALKAVVESM